MSQEPKQVIVIRSDLNMPKGKEGAQVAHAAMAFLTNRLEAIGSQISATHTMVLTGCFSQPELDWINGSFRKVVLVAHNEEELLEVYEKAKKAGLETHLITDSGYTCFAEPTNTCVGIGPDLPDKIDPITGHLKLR